VYALALVDANSNNPVDPEIGDKGPVGVKLPVYLATPFTQWKFVILPLNASEANPDDLFPIFIGLVDVKLVVLVADDPICTPLRYTFRLPVEDPDLTIAKWFHTLFNELVIAPNDVNEGAQT
jgi:hypothetical protein